LLDAQYSVEALSLSMGGERVDFAPQAAETLIRLDVSARAFYNQRCTVLQFKYIQVFLLVQAL
jgi:hypothetical protein